MSYRSIQFRQLKADKLNLKWIYCTYGQHTILQCNQRDMVANALNATDGVAYFWTRPFWLCVCTRIQAWQMKKLNRDGIQLLLSWRAAEFEEMIVHDKNVCLFILSLNILINLWWLRRRRTFNHLYFLFKSIVGYFCDISHCDCLAMCKYQHYVIKNRLIVMVLRFLIVRFSKLNVHFDRAETNLASREHTLSYMSPEELIRSSNQHFR